MVVVLRFRAPAAESSLGEALSVADKSTIELESLVPSGGLSVPFFWVYANRPDPIVDALGDLSSVSNVNVVETIGDATLIALDWDIDDDPLFRIIRRNDGHILRAVFQDQQWEITVRFPKHELLSGFKRDCEERGIGLDVDRIYHRSDQAADPWFGLTQSQREALVLAVERGYYDIPRQCTTAELADELDISAQAVTERLRRAVANITEHTLLAAGTSVKQ